MAIITLTTDFGSRDWFVGAMKGVILAIQPRATLVDLTHEIAPGDVWGGALALAAACYFFPKGTIHLAVVDPGVGSSRAALAVRTGNYTFIGPDNGILSLALQRETAVAIRRLENRKFFLEPVSGTFHGRDVFAPVAAHLSNGAAFQSLGPKMHDWVRLNPVAAAWRGPTMIGRIIYLDRFGNALTNVRENQLRGCDPRGLSITAGKRQGPFPLATFYHAVAPGKPLGLIGSSGYLEIAINAGHAGRILGLKIGDEVTIHRAKISTRGSRTKSL